MPGPGQSVGEVKLLSQTGGIRGWRPQPRRGSTRRNGAKPLWRRMLPAPSVRVKNSRPDPDATPIRLDPAGPNAPKFFESHFGGVRTQVRSNGAVAGFRPMAASLIASELSGCRRDTMTAAAISVASSVAPALLTASGDPPRLLRGRPLGNLRDSGKSAQAPLDPQVRRCPRQFTEAAQPHMAHRALGAPFFPGDDSHDVARSV